uniref:Uncharacterized protein n=1 Tax=Utricularia reniformis TaxID=192314 RepID=A0A1Y0B4A6_9LAMI|nr:hypothetical protein AEK19_MT2060 [Utricularia reniformis]ART32217.1 hypothetical protein AEK19_MT2060 [Utricularia reniformis]
MLLSLLFFGHDANHLFRTGGRLNCHLRKCLHQSFSVGLRMHKQIPNPNALVRAFLSCSRIISSFSSDF